MSHGTCDVVLGVDGFWFGPFSRASAERVDRTVDLWLTSLHEDDGDHYYVQCHHRCERDPSEVLPFLRASRAFGRP